MRTIRGFLDAIGRLKPLEISLFIMNMALVAEVWHELDAASAMRSTNIERYVQADLVTDSVLAGCLVEGR
jgi:hypothetical protein